MENLKKYYPRLGLSRPRKDSNMIRKANVLVMSLFLFAFAGFCLLQQQAANAETNGPCPATINLPNTSACSSIQYVQVGYFGCSTGLEPDPQNPGVTGISCCTYDNDIVICVPKQGPLTSLGQCQVYTGYTYGVRCIGGSCPAATPIKPTPISPPDA